jgi:class 3 adenylate cyclase
LVTAADFRTLVLVAAGELQQIAIERRAKVEEFQRKHRIGLLTLLFTDIVDSTKLKQTFGDRDDRFRAREIVQEALNLTDKYSGTDRQQLIDALNQALQILLHWKSKSEN